jgi:hypothetical protein
MTDVPTPPVRSSRPAAVGGWLVVAGCVLVVVSVVVAALGQPVAIGGGGIGGIVLALALASLAAGFLLLAIVGPSSIGSLGVRVGLALLAIGLAGVLVSSVVAGSMTYDPLEELAFVVPFLLGGLAIIVGTPLTIVALLVRDGAPRRIATLFLGGFAVVFLGGLLSSALLANDPTASSTPLAATLVAATGLALMLLAVGALGMLATRPAAHADPVVAA